MPEPMPRTPEPEVMDEPEAAEAYARSDFSGVNQDFVDAMLAFIGTLEEARSADLGTGPGDIPLRVVRARPRWHVTALDLSEPMLDFARRRARAEGLDDRVAFVRADAKDTGLPAHAFDVVFANSILHHIDETHALWTEVKRIAKRGAFLFMRDLARPATEAAAREIVRKHGSVGPELMQRDYYNSLLAAYTVDEVRAQLAEAGLDAVEVRRVTDRHWDAWGRVT